MEISGWGRFGRLVSGRRSWIVLLIALAITGAIMAAPKPGDASTAPNALPDTVEAAQVSKILKEFPDAGVSPALAVFTRGDDSRLSRDDLAAAATAYTNMMKVDRGTDTATETAGQAQGRPPVIPSPDGQAAIVVVPVDADLTGFPLNDVVKNLRTTASQNLPAGLTAQVTGGPAFGADISNAFAGADVTLLASTALVVAVLLLITYRSPILWLVPLIVVAVADRTAGIVAALIADLAGFTLDGSTTGISSVLVFGAGTNYALLLVSRYREELRAEADHRVALARAVRHAGPAILASNVTVVLALATLVAATLPSTRVLGFAAAIGLLVALVFALFVLPPALSLAGRKLFWPFVPRVGDRDPSETGAWHRLAMAVSHRPLVTLLATTPLLLICAAGFFGVRVGLTQTEQFRVKAESVSGFETLADHFPPGLSNPTTVIARTTAAPGVTSALKGVTSVESATPTGQSETGWSRWQVVLKADPASPEAFAAVDAVRDAVRAVPDGEAKVGGPDAEQHDSRQAAERDQRLILPLILGVVFLVLLALLRALPAALLLIAATTLSAFAAIGAGAWISTHLLGFPGIDTSVMLFAFLFLVALGVDYTIFLVTRAREETPGRGTREGIVRAVALTGGVITSAGIVLAAVFAVLGVLPLITLTQLGIIVGLGILLDTFLVRTIVIPALFTMVGDRVWWPSRLASTSHER